MLLDRFVNLLTRGCVVPVLKYMKQCWVRGDTDTSLIRYFVNEVRKMPLKLDASYFWVNEYLFVGVGSGKSPVLTRVCAVIPLHG
jgi:hypothetical protein